MRTAITLSMILVGACGGRVDDGVGDVPGIPTTPSPSPIPAPSSSCSPGPSLYENTFDEDRPEGSVYPKTQGEGSLCTSASVVAAFTPQYHPRVVRYPDGKRGIRFPTRTETPGGYDYSMMAPFVLFRGPFLSEPCLSIRSVVRLPERYDLDKPPYYGDVRGLFRYYIEGQGARELLSVRYTRNDEIGIYENDARRPERLQLPAAAKGGSAITVVVDGCFVPRGKVSVTVMGVTQTITLGDSFAQGDVFYVTSPGNSVLSDDDTKTFSSLDEVEVTRSAPK